MGRVEIDHAVNVIRIPNAPRYNPAESPNHIRAWWKRWNEIPDCALKENHLSSLAAWAQLEKPAHMTAWRETFGGSEIGKPFGRADGDLAHSDPVSDPVNEAVPVTPDKTHHTFEQSPRTATAVQDVLQYWQRQRYHLGAKPYLTTKRKELVALRLADGFTALQLQQAIRGATFDDWYMGKLAASPGFKGIEHLFKDVERVEKFRDLALQHHWTERSVALEASKLAAAAAAGLAVDALDGPPTVSGSTPPPLDGPAAHQAPANGVPAAGDTPAAAAPPPRPPAAAAFDPDAPDPEWEKQLAELKEIASKIGAGRNLLPPEDKPS
jgi:hypothetical protein